MGILSLIILVPLCGMLVILCLPAERKQAIRQTALVCTGVNVALSIYLLRDYLGRLASGAMPDTGTALDLQYVERIPWLQRLGIEYFLGVDGISVLMIFLTAVVIFCGVCASWYHEHRAKEFFAFLLLLVGGVFGVFAAADLFLFFLFYEIAVLPMCLLIGLWGTGPKEYSAMKLRTASRVCSIAAESWRLKTAPSARRSKSFAPSGP